MADLARDWPDPWSDKGPKLMSCMLEARKRWVAGKGCHISTSFCQRLRPFATLHPSKKFYTPKLGLSQRSYICWPLAYSVILQSPKAPTKSKSPNSEGGKKRKPVETAGDSIAEPSLFLVVGNPVLCFFTLKPAFSFISWTADSTFALFFFYLYSIRSVPRTTFFYRWTLPRAANS